MRLKRESATCWVCRQRWRVRCNCRNCRRMLGLQLREIAGGGGQVRRRRRRRRRLLLLRSRRRARLWHTSAYVSIRQHTSRTCASSSSAAAGGCERGFGTAFVSIRQHTSAFVSIRQHTSAYASMQAASADVCAQRQYLNVFTSKARSLVPNLAHNTAKKTYADVC
jgi:hypothetical protein